MSAGSAPAARRSAVVPAVAAVAAGGLLIVFLLDPPVGALGGLLAAAGFAWQARMWWLAACAGAWALVFLAVLTFPGPYDSWAGRAIVPVLAGYALCFLGGWGLGRRTADRADGQRPELTWPAENRLRWYLLGLFAVAVGAAVLRFRGAAPPLFAADPDAARDALGHRDNMATGLLSETWTLGMSVSLLRALTGPARARWWYAATAGVFTAGAALGASKNAVLVGIVPAVVAALSVRRTGPRHAVPGRRHATRTRVIVAVGLVAVAGAAFLGGQRTLAGTGAFEDEFRARYGGNPVATGMASLDLSLSSPAETFGRLWAQRDTLPPRWGAYTLKFLGRHAEPVIGKTDLYGITGQLSAPYYMNTATFVAIPLLDYGAAGAALFLLVLGVFVGLGDRRLEFSAGPAQQLGRGFLVYFAAFGIYELYPALYPTWLALLPGLWLLHRLGRPAGKAEAAP
jgi:hypothetical protein